MTGLRYLGHGVAGRQEFIPGVPARDLSADEARRFAAIIEEHRRNTGRALYGSLADEPAMRTTDDANDTAAVEPRAEDVKGAGRPRSRREQQHGE